MRGLSPGKPRAADQIPGVPSFNSLICDMPAESHRDCGDYFARGAVWAEAAFILTDEDTPEGEAWYDLLIRCERSRDGHHLREA